MKIASSGSSRAQVTAAGVAADGRSVAAGHVSCVGSVHGVHEATSRPDDRQPARQQAFIGYRAVNGHGGSVNPVNAPAHRVGRVNGGSDDWYATNGDAGGEARGMRRVLPDGSPPPYPPVDLAKGGSGTPETSSRETPETPQNRRVSGQCVASLPGADGGGGRDD